MYAPDRLIGQRTQQTQSLAQTIRFVKSPPPTTTIMASPPQLFDILEISGLSIEVYSYLQPQDLCRLSRCNRFLFGSVKSIRHDVLKSHLPIELVDDASKDAIYLQEGHTYPDKVTLQDFLVDKFDRGGILVRDTHTKEHSIERARHLFKTQNWCHLRLPEHTFNALAECSIEEIDMEYANKMIGWNDCKAAMEQNVEMHKFAMDWVRYLLADPDVKIRRWNWIANHPNFRHQSVRGTGIM